MIWLEIKILIPKFVVIIQGRSQTQNLGGGIFFGRTKFPKLILFIFMKTDRLFPRSS